MREIKFRAKNKDTGEWVVGSNHLDQWPSNTLQWLSRFWEWVEGGILDPETVGQYTGLPDKNGQEIYEGDILKTLYNPKYVVESLFEFAIDWGYYSEAWTEFPMEVIGNIYENPELLEDK